MTMLDRKARYRLRLANGLNVLGVEVDAADLARALYDSGYLDRWQYDAGEDHGWHGDRREWLREALQNFIMKWIQLGNEAF
jgi:hypothetical protein